MKKKLLAFLAVLTLACAAGGCSLSKGFEDSQIGGGNSQAPTSEIELPEVSETPATSESEVPETSEKPSTSEGGAETPESTHEYKSFTPSEKNLFLQYIGEVIP